jgi:glycosyltransferase involved in cell wall biosynthesis
VTDVIRIDPHVVHVVYGEVLHPAIDSQVVAPLAALAARGMDVELVVYVSPRGLISGNLRRQHRARLQELRRQIPGRVTFLTFGPRHALRILSTARLARGQRRALRGGGPVIVHARGPRAANLAVPVSLRHVRAGVIYDCRGALAEEYRLIHGQGTIRDARELEAAVRQEAREERRAASDVDRIFAVSEPLAEYLADTYDIPRNDIRVIRGPVDTTLFRPDSVARAATRQELEIPDQARVLCYCGSASVWERPVETARLAAAVRQEDPGTILLVLTSDPQPFQDAAAAAGLAPEALRVLAVGHPMVPRYLAAADAGVLLRESTPLNRISCPGKFPEYLACGLPVILTNGVGDASERVAAERCGVVLDSVADGEFARVRAALDGLGDPGQVQSRCLQLARRDHGVEVALEQWLAEYRSLTDQLLARR